VSAETDTGPLAGWAIVQASGLTLIGRLPLANGPVDLSPVYELRPMLDPQRGIAHMVLPVWLLGVDSISIPSGAIVHPCEELSRSQRVHLHRAVQQGEQVSAAMRAQESGVVLAPESALRGLGKP
jgi:hypothetical protein